MMINRIQHPGADPLPPGTPCFCSAPRWQNLAIDASRAEVIESTKIRTARRLKLQAERSATEKNYGRGHFKTAQTAQETAQTVQLGLC